VKSNDRQGPRPAPDASSSWTDPEAPRFPHEPALRAVAGADREPSLSTACSSGESVGILGRATASLLLKFPRAVASARRDATCAAASVASRTSPFSRMEAISASG
jgi:hypothetical protein